MPFPGIIITSHNVEQQPAPALLNQVLGYPCTKLNFERRYTLYDSETADLPQSWMVMIKFKSNTDGTRNTRKTYRKHDGQTRQLYCWRARCRCCHSIHQVRRQLVQRAHDGRAVEGAHLLEDPVRRRVEQRVHAHPVVHLADQVPLADQVHLADQLLVRHARRLFTSSVTRNADGRPRRLRDRELVLVALDRR